MANTQRVTISNTDPETVEHPHPNLLGMLTREYPVRRISLNEYHHLIEQGFFRPEERLELVEGLLLPMSPSGIRHAECIRRLSNILFLHVSGKAVVNTQLPITLPDHESEPEPDISVATVQPDGYVEHHPYPADIYWVIEVSDSTLASDRELKVALYAVAGIPEYWIVNLVDDQIEVYRRPTTLGSGASGYLDKVIFQPGEIVSPLNFPDCELEVRKIIPERQQ